MKTRSRNGIRGFNLIEGAITLAIASLTVGSLVSSFAGITDRQRLDRVATQVRTDMQFTRSLAVARNQTVRMSFATPVNASCYVIHTGSVNSCHCAADGTSSCNSSSVALRTVAFRASSDHLTVRSNSASILFDAYHGTVTPTASVQVEGNSGRVLKVIVNIMGRTRLCAATQGLPAYPSC